MTVNAYLAARQVRNIRTKARKWRFINDQWTQTELDANELKFIKETEEKVFQTFMTKVTMCAILNRNTKDNTMVEVLSGLRKEEIQEEQEQRGEDGMVKKLMSKMKKRETEEENR